MDVAQWVDSYKSNNDMMAELSGKIVGMSVVRHTCPTTLPIHFSQSSLQRCSTLTFPLACYDTSR